MTGTGRRPWRVPTWTLAGALTAGLLGGCGVPSDQQPRALQPGEAPYASPRTSPIADPEGALRAPLHFVRDGSVVLVARPVEGFTSTADLLELLFGGPAPEESMGGLVTEIPSTVTVEDVTVNDETAVITLGGPESEVLRLQQAAYAQIVATLTPSRVSGVRFRLGSTDLRVPRGDGSLTAAPVSRDDYAALLAAPAAAAPSPSPSA